MTTERAREALEVRMGTVMRALADAEDLHTTLMWDVERSPGQPSAPAWFSPSERTVTINAEFALRGDVVADVNPLTPEGRRKHPHIIGLGCHEASHVRFTHWGEEDRKTLAGESSSVQEIVTLLEEPRIEKRYLSVRPHEQPYLRAQSVLLDTSQFHPPSEEEREAMEGEGWVDGWRAGTLALLTLARGDAGVLEPEDLMEPRRILSLTLGDTLDRLEPLWKEALNLEDGDVSGLTDVARRWVGEVGEKPHGIVAIAVCPGEPPEAPEFADDMLVASEVPPPEEDLISSLVTDLVGEIKEGNNVEAEAQMEAEAQDDADQEQRDQGDKDAKAQKKAQEKAQEFFGDPAAGPKKLNLAQERKRREATDAERQMAVRMADAIRRARFRERDKVNVLSERPPGRLQGREAMLYTAQRSMRMKTTAKPFKTRLSHYTEEPPLKAGIMTDVSGSMKALTGFATALSWAMASSLEGIGKSISVAYNSQVTVLNAPGEFPPHPYPLSAAGGGEDWRTAFSLVDGSLNLTMGRGARLLFVISDGEYAPAQVDAARDAVRRLERGGAKVIWFAPERSASVSLVRILGARHLDDPRLVLVPPKLTSSFSGAGRIDGDPLVEKVISEVTLSLQRGLSG